VFYYFNRPADASARVRILDWSRTSQKLGQPLPESYWLLTCWCICSCAYPGLVQNVPEAGPSAPRVVLSTDLLMQPLLESYWVLTCWCSHSPSRTEYWPADASARVRILDWSRTSQKLGHPLPESYWVLTCWCICSCAYPRLVQNVPEAGPPAPRVVLGGAAEVICPAHHTTKKIGQCCRILRFDNVCYPSFYSKQCAMFRRFVSVNVNILMGIHAH
jgi:hypothetical protein